jgi:uncharacterized protein (UPF0335 family)
MASAGNNADDALLIEHVEKIERLLEERSVINDDIKDIKTLAKSQGYDPRIMMQVIKIRAMERELYQEQKTLLDTYLAAFGIED